MKKFFIVIVLFFIISNNSFAQEAQVVQEEINLMESSQIVPVTNEKTVEKAAEKMIIIPDSSLQAQVVAQVPTYIKLTLPQAIDYAQKNNFHIKGTRLNIDKGKNDIKTAGRFQNPYMNIFFNGGVAATDNPDSFGLIQPFEIGKRGPRKRLAKSNLELTKGNVALAEFYLRLDVRQSYVDLVAAKSILKILEGQKKLLEELAYVAQRKFEVGAAPEMDVIQAKMTLNQLVTQVNTARTNVDVARYNFNKVLDASGYDSAEDYLPEQKDFIFLLTPKPQDKMPEFDKVSNIATAKRIDLKNAQQEIDIAQKNLVVVARQRIPDIEIGGGMLMVPDALTTAIGPAYGYYAISNITNIPLFYQYAPEIRNAKIQVCQKEFAYNGLRHDALMDLNSAYEEFVTAQTNINYYNDALLAEANQFLGMSKRSYEVGKTNITNLIFIQQSYKSILMGYTNALATYYNSWVDFLREVNDEDFKLDEK